MTKDYYKISEFGPSVDEQKTNLFKALVRRIHVMREGRKNRDKIVKSSKSKRKLFKLF